jgi:hypothetical protein
MIFKIERLDCFLYIKKVKTVKKKSRKKKSL